MTTPSSLFAGTVAVAQPASAGERVYTNGGPDSGCNETSVLKTKVSDSSSVSAKFDKLVTC
ncbi:hypothetical protein HQQ81_00870 [Microbacteriaceae bacterium VKM Ac-2854]|nr:hypothetical protein [Microbacteriaceae bacterium VKM Ac-2854]